MLLLKYMNKILNAICTFEYIKYRINKPLHFFSFFLFLSTFSCIIRDNTFCVYFTDEIVAF